MVLKRRGAERKGRSNTGLVTEALLKVNAVKVHLQGAQEANPCECPANGIAGPKLSHTCPTHSEVEGPGKRAIDEKALPVFHVQSQSRSTLKGKLATVEVAQ